MSETTEKLTAPEWQRSRYGESEQLNLGCVSIVISRPIGTQGTPAEPLAIRIGEIRLKRNDIQNFLEARAYALITAEAFLERSLARARAAIARATPREGE